MTELISLCAKFKSMKAQKLWPVPNDSNVLKIPSFWDFNISGYGFSIKSDQDMHVGRKCWETTLEPTIGFCRSRDFEPAKCHGKRTRFAPVE
jgi:hypothetical protein